MAQGDDGFSWAELQGVVKFLEEMQLHLSLLGPVMDDSSLLRVSCWGFSWIILPFIDTEWYINPFRLPLLAFLLYLRDGPLRYYSQAIMERLQGLRNSFWLSLTGVGGGQRPVGAMRWGRCMGRSQPQGGRP